MTAMAWDTPDHITSDSSGLVLIGTALGLVFEAELVDTGPERGALMGGLFKGNTLERRWEQVCKAGFIFVQYLLGFLGQFFHLDICFLSTLQQMPQTITNIPRCLPQILTLPKFWYHLAHSFSPKNGPLALGGRSQPLK